jgi:hypothetical protein
MTYVDISFQSNVRNASVVILGPQCVDILGAADTDPATLRHFAELLGVPLAAEVIAVILYHGHYVRLSSLTGALFAYFSLFYINPFVCQCTYCPAEAY